MPSVETLPLLLKQLGLPSMSSHWESMVDEAIEKEWKHPVYLAALSELEVASRYSKRVQRHTKESKPHFIGS